MIVRETGVSGPPRFLYYETDLFFSVGHVHSCIVVMQDTSTLMWKVLGDYRDKGRSFVLVVPDYHKVWHVELQDLMSRRIPLPHDQPEFLQGSGEPFGFAPKRLFAYVFSGQGIGARSA